MEPHVGVERMRGYAERLGDLTAGLVPPRRRVVVRHALRSSSELRCPVVVVVGLVTDVDVDGLPGRDMNVRFTAVVLASPSTVVRAAGVVDERLLIVCGIIGSPASLSDADRDVGGRARPVRQLEETRPLTLMNELLGASDSAAAPGCGRRVGQRATGCRM